jgi:hypothetical protein
MHGIVIGDIELLPQEDGRIMLVLDVLEEQQDYSWWTVQDATKVVAYLQAWIQEQEGKC